MVLKPSACKASCRNCGERVEGTERAGANRETDARSPSPPAMPEPLPKKESKLSSGLDENRDLDREKEPVIFHREEIVDLKCFKLIKRVYSKGDNVANMDAWNVWKAKSKLAWKAYAEGGDRLWLRHEVRAELSAETFFKLS